MLETDEYLYTEVGNDPASYNYREESLLDARAWNLARFRRAVAKQISPIIVDRGNGLNPETRCYAIYSVDNGYSVQLQEPDSPWWQELRVLLKYKQHIDDKLSDAWAAKLAEATRKTHRVPRSTILRWISRWKYDLTVEDILRLGITDSV